MIFLKQFFIKSHYKLKFLILLQVVLNINCFSGFVSDAGAMAIPTKNERKAIWSNRKQLAKDAHYLPLVLQITNWAKSHKVKEIHR